MTGCGPTVDRYLRLVYATEPTTRLRDLGERFRTTLT